MVVYRDGKEWHEMSTPLSDKAFLAVILAVDVMAVIMGVFLYTRGTMSSNLKIIILAMIVFTIPISVMTYVVVRNTKPGIFRFDRDRMYVILKNGREMTVHIDQVMSFEPINAPMLGTAHSMKYKESPTDEYPRYLKFDKDSVEAVTRWLREQGK